MRASVQVTARSACQLDWLLLLRPRMSDCSIAALLSGQLQQQQLASESEAQHLAVKQRQGAHQTLTLEVSRADKDWQSSDHTDWSFRSHVMAALQTHFWMGNSPEPLVTSMALVDRPAFQVTQLSHGIITIVCGRKEHNVALDLRQFIPYKLFPASVRPSHCKSVNPSHWQLTTGTDHIYF